MLKHILFLRPIDLQDLQKIILSGPFSSGIDISNNQIFFGRLEINYIYGNNQLIIGFECDAPREIDIETFYSIVEHIGNYQIAIHHLYKI